MNFWFIGIIAIYILALGNALGRHGTLRVTRLNFWAQLVITVIWTFIIYMAIKTGF